MKKIALMLLGIALFGVLVVEAQVKSISGTITSSEDGTGIPGVSVVVKGTTIGTVTNIDGNYQLEVPNDAEAILFSFVGMKSIEKPISGSVVDAVLEPDYVGVEEVIVTGYAVKGKNEITGSTVQVKGEQLQDVPVTSIDQALQGKVAGLSISASSGTPGSTQDIRIRGVGSITAGNDPLIVIDGVPVINDNFTGSSSRSSLSALSSFNSNDVESITVLKDASATSAYGARGSNGVIVITTKKGKMGETKFNAKATVGFQNDATDGLTPLTGEHRAELLEEAAYNTYGADYGFTKDEAYDFIAENLTSKLQVWNDTYNRKEGNWADELANKNALVQNYDVSASGGDAVSSFYASLGYNKTEATIVDIAFQRVTGKLNYNRNLSDKVKFSTNATVSNTVQDAFLEQGAYFGNPNLTKYFMSPWEQPYDEDGNLNTNLTTSIFNTLYTLENDISKNDHTRALSNSFLEWEIIENLKFKTLVALDYNVAAYHSYQNRIHGDSQDENGTTNESVERNFNWVTQNSLDYRLTLGDHNISMKALMEYQTNKRNYLYGYGENFPADGLYYIASAGANYDASSNFTDWKNLSYLGMVNYNYAGKYIADVTYRREGSSRFAPGLRFGDFYSFGAAWNMNEEDFMASVDFVDVLRLRGSYGLSGSSAIDINSYQALLSYDANYADEGAIYPSQFGNPELTWEKNKNFDLGFDFDLFNGRIGGSFAYFHKETFDLLQDVPMSRTTGHDEISMNVGTMVNKGIEVVTDFAVVRSKDLNINITANIATVNNEVTELATDAAGNEINIEDGYQKVAVGHPVYGWNMRKYAGVNPDNGSAQWYVNGVDGEVTESYYDAEKAWQGGSGLPKLTGGLGLHVDFKGIFFDMNMYYAGGHKVYEDWSFYTHHSGLYTLLYYQGVENMMDRWQEPGDVTDVPKVLFTTSSNDSRTSTRFLFDGDYMRVKDLVLGYSLPTSLVQEIGLDGLTLSVRGTNLFTWVKDDGLKYDPEVRADGFTRLTTPPVKSVVFGVNINF